MKVKELIAELQHYDPELEVIYERFSDYNTLTPDDLWIVKAVDKGDYVERYYNYQFKNPSEQPNFKECLAFPGN